MDKEVPTIDGTIEEIDTETTDDLSPEERDGDTYISPDENDNAAETAEPQISTSEPAVLPPDAEVLASVNQRLLTLQELFEKQIARNQKQKQMFDAIYGEMKDYKENVLLEAFHKQVIHNLIQFYDNLASIESQLDRISEPFEAFEAWSDSISDGMFKKICPQELADELSVFRAKLKEELPLFRMSLENLRFELEEVLYRMDVIPYEEHLKKLDRELHKTVDTKPTDNPDEDRDVAEIHKIGFYWREKVFRPEVVTIFRYIQPAGESTETVGEETVGRNPTGEKGDETDG